MSPSPGQRRQKFVGDSIRFLVRDAGGRAPIPGWRAMLRTNIGRAELLRREILEAHTRGLPPAGSSWRDLPMHADAEGWSLELPLVEVGYFKAKAYLLDPRGWQHWPEGPDVGIAVHPNGSRTGNILYCAFTRMFGASKELRIGPGKNLEATLAPLDKAGYTVIPPSGKLRDLIPELPHIFQRLGCRILHLLPVNPVPTTYARFGRYGSPYAALDLTMLDPALVDFDRRSTGVEQFCELTHEAHRLGGRVFLDFVINHTGWGSVLQENHPEWFLRGADDVFVSPGAWGTIWEDLVELKHDNVNLWDQLAEMLLTWCRRGVDGFRCDAGYKVPVRAWQYIVARVQQEFPEAIFFLEGLGGAWELTEQLLTEGGMQWAYSELFQNYSGLQVAGYLEHSFGQQVGLLVHYSETHDNERLAVRGRVWSLLRNRLCGLSSVSGGFGFTCGVEWLATEKIDVHGSAGLAWGSDDNLLSELAALNRLLTDHPCFFDGATLERLSPPASPVYALLRRSEEGLDQVLVLINTDAERPNTALLPAPAAAKLPKLAHLAQWPDLLGQAALKFGQGPDGSITVPLAPGAAHCLAPRAEPKSLSGDAYRRVRAEAAWALQAASHVLPVEQIGGFDWKRLGKELEASPAEFLARVSHLARETRSAASVVTSGLLSLPPSSRTDAVFPAVIAWTTADVRRVTPVPAEHWLLLEDSVPFRATLEISGECPRNVESLGMGARHFAFFPPRQRPVDGLLKVERYAAQVCRLEAAVRFLALQPEYPDAALRHPGPDSIILLTNGRGGMARLCADLGRVRSKYDCALAANLHPDVPVDRHVFVKRLRAWVTADGFISALDFHNLTGFQPGPPAQWEFVANAGDGRTVEITLSAAMLPGCNSTVFQFSRPRRAEATGKPLPPGADVRLTVRVDLEDRNFHWETRRNPGAEHHFSSRTRPLARAPEPPSNQGSAVGTAQADEFRGFVFEPAPERRLVAVAEGGVFHPQAEWSENIAHPVEQSRAMTGSGDAWSPGWFELPLPSGARPTVRLTAEAEEAGDAQVAAALTPTARNAGGEDGFSAGLRRALDAFVVRRGNGRTVIAGYPWFLDWGRDTFICARGLLAAGLLEEVRQVLHTFGRLEKDGTLPNSLAGEDASNRDTSDAPLWFGLVHEELAAVAGPDPAVVPVLESIARHYTRGTPNGIRLDPGSGLIWSPAHFTWMDTNYPAATPREGYPVEIQALWIRLLRQLARCGDEAGRMEWAERAEKAQRSFTKLFWLERENYYSDVLLAGREQPAGQGTPSDALRSNALLAVSLGVAEGARARACVEAARRYLVVPGALRSLAPLPVRVPLPVPGPAGPLNNPLEPYWGRYEGDEDTRRKPAYHNGTAWTWSFPLFCEALVRAWDFSPAALAAARSYLSCMGRLLGGGCLGHLPEVLDGDAPHTPRGCDAQAWAATETFRVWKLLQEL